MTDDQIRECLSQDGDRTAMLKAAYRMGMAEGAKRAAEYCDAVAHDYTQEGDNESAAVVLEVALDIEEHVLSEIRAAVGEC